MPESRSLTQEYVTALFFLRRDDENIAVQRKHLEVDPINAESHFDLGLVYLIQGSNREAADHLTDATRLAPINGKAQAAPTKALEATGESAAATARARAQALGYDSP
jgi:Flp pilus assembly protein TadD